MKTLILTLTIILSSIRLVNVTIYPQATDDCMTDTCLAENVIPSIEYDGF